MKIKVAAALAAGLLLAAPVIAQEKGGPGAPPATEKSDVLPFKGNGKGEGRREARGDGKEKGGPRAACRSDVQQFCANVEKGGGRIRQCLDDNKAKLSAGCAEALASAKRGGKGKRADAGERAPAEPIQR